MTYSKKVDAPLEQAAEAILETHGIDVDFSAGKKNDNNTEVSATKSK